MRGEGGGEIKNRPLGRVFYFLNKNNLELDWRERVLGREEYDEMGWQNEVRKIF